MRLGIILDSTPSAYAVGRAFAASQVIEAVATDASSTLNIVTLRRLDRSNEQLVHQHGTNNRMAPEWSEVALTSLVVACLVLLSFTAVTLISGRRPEAEGLANWVFLAFIAVAAQSILTHAQAWRRLGVLLRRMALALMPLLHVAALRVIHSIRHAQVWSRLKLLGRRVTLVVMTRLRVSAVRVTRSLHVYAPARGAYLSLIHIAALVIMGSLQVWTWLSGRRRYVGWVAFPLLGTSTLLFLVQIRAFGTAVLVANGMTAVLVLLALGRVWPTGRRRDEGRRSSEGEKW